MRETNTNVTVSLVSKTILSLNGSLEELVRARAIIFVVMIYYSEKIQTKISKNEKVHGETSGRNQV